MPKQNIGSADALIRYGTGWVCLYFGFIQPDFIGELRFATLLGFFGVVLLLTSIFCYCPLYALAGIKTLFRKRKHQHQSHANLTQTKAYFLSLVTLLALLTLLVLTLATSYGTEYRQQPGDRWLMAGTALLIFYLWAVLIGTRYISKKFKFLNRARKKSEAFTSLLLNSTAEAIYGVDKAGACTFCNPATLALLGYREMDEVLGKNVHDLMHHSHADGSVYPASDCPMNRVISEGVPVHCDQEVFWRADHTYFYVEYWGHPIKRNERIVGMVMTFLDITQRRVVETEMRMLSQAVEQAKDLTVITDNAGMIYYANPAFYEITGLDSHDIVGKDIGLLHETLGEVDEKARIVALLNAGETYQESFINHHKNGQPYYLDLAVFGLKNAHGGLESIVFTGRDVTERVDSEESIRRSENDKIEAEAANQSKSIFLANMSHEIRTPMTAIVGFAESLLDEGISPKERQEAVETIIRGGQHLTRIINDILDLSKIEANRIDIECIPVMLLDHMRDIRSIILIQAEQKHIRFEINFDLPLPETMVTDPTRLRQILLNLLSNAVKFTRVGQVMLTIRYAPATHLLYFQVKDTGIGLTQDQQRKLFTPFSQAESSTTRQYGGTGLGLHISKQLAEKMGGTITLESQPKQGSTFTLSIDSGITEALSSIECIDEMSQICQQLQAQHHFPTVDVGAEVKARTARILLSEDSKVSQALITRWFKDSDIDISIAENGEIAVEEVFKSDFDLVLTDIQMPIMGGLEATKRMRDKGFNKPIIAITANVMQDDIQSYHNAGCDAVIPKPVDKQAFFDIIYEYLSASQDHTYKPKTQQVGAIPQLSGEILLAEDNADNQRLVRLLVNKTGANLTITEDGLSAIEHTLAKEYHLILMDTNMPLMDGLEATQKLRKAGYTLPIYALTADTDADQVKAFKACGYDGHLSKPIDTELLYGILKKYLPGNTPSVTPTPSVSAPTQRYLQAVPMVEEEDAEMAGLMALFAERLPPMIEETELAIMHQEWEAAAAVIHNIKGTAGSFGHPELTELAGQLSNIFKQEDYALVPDIFAKVKAYAVTVNAVK